MSLRLHSLIHSLTRPRVLAAGAVAVGLGLAYTSSPPAPSIAPPLADRAAASQSRSALRVALQIWNGAADIKTTVADSLDDTGDPTTTPSPTTTPALAATPAPATSPCPSSIHILATGPNSHVSLSCRATRTVRSRSSSSVSVTSGSSQSSTSGGGSVHNSNNNTVNVTIAND
jgi:hypothetical protein